jgi:hypothetical protein
MEEYKTLFCPSKFPWARERIYSKFTHNLGTRQPWSECEWRSISLPIQNNDPCPLQPKSGRGLSLSDWSILGPVGLSAPTLLLLSSWHLYPLFLKNQAAWNFLSPELEVTWHTVTIIIRVFFFLHICAFVAFLCLPFITINHAAYILTKDTKIFA